ncbi:MAG: ABC transporter permease subunit [Thermoplasmata archaeon]
MGIDPIEYTTWNGKRTKLLHRTALIANKIFNKSLRSKGVLALLIIGSVLVHAFPILLTAFAPYEKLDTDIIRPYMRDGLFALFSILLAAVVTSDIISADYHDNSFILYFSRPIKPLVYMFSKLLGALSVLGLFCLLMPVTFGITVMGTQTGSDYTTSFKMLGLTVVAGIFTTFFFVAMGVMFSSLTKRKAYAGVGTFIGFFAPMTLGEFFAYFDPNWRLLSPVNILHFTYDLIYGFDLPTEISSNYYYLALTAYLAFPLIVSYVTLQKKAVGK